MGRGGVDSLMATFNNYELQFFVGGCCLKKTVPHSVQRTHLKLALILCGAKSAAAANAAAAATAAAVPGMWPKKCGNKNYKQKTKTFTTTTATCSEQKQQKAIKLWHFASTKAIKVVAARCRQKTLAA